MLLPDQILVLLEVSKIDFHILIVQLIFFWPQTKNFIHENERHVSYLKLTSLFLLQ